MSTGEAGPAGREGERLAAEWIYHTLPGYLPEGCHVQVAALVRNTGTAEWARSVGGRGFDVAVFLDGRFLTNGRLLQPRVRPGEKAGVALHLPGLPAGRHEIALDMVEQEVALFGDLGNPPRLIPIEVGPGRVPRRVDFREWRFRARYWWFPMLRQWARRTALSLVLGALPRGPARERVLEEIKGANAELLDLERSIRRTWLLSRPPSVIIDSSTGCNLRCPRCFRQNLGFDLGRAPGLSAATVGRIVGELFPTARSASVSSIGEPLLSPHLGLMVRACARYGVRLSLITNGTLLGNEALFSGIAPVLGHLEVSIDTLQPELFATLRRGADLGEVLENVRRVSRVRRDGGAGFDFGLSVTLFEENLEELPGLVEWAADTGLDFVRAGIGVVFDPADAKSSVLDHPDRLEEALRMTRAVAERRAINVILPKPPHRVGVSGGTRPPICDFLYQVARVNHKGEVESCLHHTPPFLVSLRGRSFRRAWNSPGLRKLRRRCGTPSAPAVCATCYILDWDTLSPEERRSQFFCYRLKEKRSW